MCAINYSREYTPLVYFLSPSTVYYGEEVSIYVDPKNVLAYRILELEFPFIEARIDGHLLNFEGWVDEFTVLNYG